MAEIQQQVREPGGKQRAKKASLKIDMTPMVDLAFLLLTFFMLTTTFAKPSVMQLTMPVEGEKTAVSYKKAMTIILGKNHRVHYYYGLNAPHDPTVPAPALHTTSFAARGIRQEQRQRQQPGTIVLIKPSAEARYQDMVDILDEMSITNQKKYALVRISQDDSHLLKTATL